LEATIPLLMALASDYIHVDDLAEAHVLGLQALADHRFDFDVFNLGNGRGFSNSEVVETARKVTGHPIPVTVNERRPGDAARLIAASDHAKEVLHWSQRIKSW
jgi:UDP-glucose 4-epimerase